MSLKIVLMGTGEFALPPFRALIESTVGEVVGVYTQPERTGRGHHRHVNQVKQLAIENDVPVFQPAKINTESELEGLRSLNADAFVVAAYGQILKPDLLAIPRLGAFNLHGSLLPRHRGAAPVQYAIWKGDRQTGVTIFQIEPSLDSGPMVGRAVTEIGDQETSGELMMRLAELSVELTLDVVRQLDQGTARFDVQDSAEVTRAPKIQKHDGIIDWSQTAEQVDCHVRAMQPWPKPVTWLHGDDRKPIRCIVTDVSARMDGAKSSTAVGQLRIDDKRLTVQCGSGKVLINTIQPEGKKPMDAMALVNGYGIGSSHMFLPSA